MYFFGNLMKYCKINNAKIKMLWYSRYCTFFFLFNSHKPILTTTNVIFYNCIFLSAENVLTSDPKAKVL